MLDAPPSPNDLADGSAVDAEPMTVRALVVDDTEVNRTVLVSQLQRFGVEATTCTNGVEALEQLESSSFDIVLMDWHMPELDGLQALVLHHSRCFESDIAPTPIVMVTADASDESRQRCLNAGATDFLAKPVSLSMLRTSVAAVVGEDKLAPDPSAPRTSAPAPGLVDRHVIEQMVDDLGGADPVRMVIDAFIADADERLAAVTEARTASTTAEARRASHTLKSTSALLGAHGLSAAAKNLEATFDRDELPTAQALDGFTKLFDATLAELRSVRDGLASA